MIIRASNSFTFLFLSNFPTFSRNNKIHRIKAAYLHAYRLFGKRKREPVSRNAFWDSAKHTVILIRVAIRKVFPWDIICEIFATLIQRVLYRSRIGKSSSKGDVRRCSRSTNTRRVVTNVISCKWSRFDEGLESQRIIRQKFARTYVRHAFTFVECLAKVSVSGTILMQATRNRCTRPMQLSRHIVEADSREGGKGKRHEARHGGLLIASIHTHTHSHIYIYYICRRRCSTWGYLALDSSIHFYFIESHLLLIVKNKFFFKLCYTDREKIVVITKLYSRP